MSIEDDFNEIMSQCASAESVAAFNRLYSHVDRLSAMVPSWQKMDTAPTDGEVVLLAVDDAPNEKPLVVTGSWDQTVAAWDTQLGMLETRDELSPEREWPPILWARLPRPDAACIQKADAT